MQETSYYNIPLYEENDMASLTDGVNRGFKLIDSALRHIQNEINILEQRVANLEKGEAE